MGQYYNNYPLVLLSGWNGWGEGDKVDRAGYFPYWHFLLSGDLIKHLRENGYEVYYPDLGPWNSAWDRACILWAYLFGGRVDYGKVHSKKFNHARYGKEYPGVLKDLGETEAHKKINIYGHSFGGPAVKEICNLFVNGCEEERAGTDPEDLSPLFAGGHGNLIHTATTLSGVNNGTTLASMMGKRGSDALNTFFLGLNTLIGDTPLMRGVNLHTQQWGIMPEPEDITGWHFRNPLSKWQEIKNFNANNGMDNSMHEMQVECIQSEINPRQKMGDTIYYFAQRGVASKKLPNGLDVPGVFMNPIAMVVELPTALSARALKRRLARYIDVSHLEEEWGPNDGFVNLKGVSAPIGAPQEDATADTEFKPGIWYNMPIEPHDHMSWNGMSIGAKELYRIWDRMTDVARQLPDGEDVAK